LNIRDDLIIQASLPDDEQLTFHTTWGLFSPREVDEGSFLLLKHLIVKPDDACLDIGCGYGVLGLWMARKTSKPVHLVDKDFVAIDYTTTNIGINRLPHATAYLSNGFSHVPSDVRFDLIVSNIPAKVGRELLTILLTDAYDRLNPGGRMVVVTINGLREFMKKNLKLVFGNYDKLKQGRAYTVAMGVKS
jgi:16S rRNA (guanine1207-N2)-methyltransferase